MGDDRRNVETFGIVDTAACVAHRDDPGTVLGQQFPSDAARVAKSLDRHSGAAQVNAEHLAGFAHHKEAAACGRLIAAKRATQECGLAKRPVSENELRTLEKFYADRGCSVRLWV